MPIVKPNTDVPDEVKSRWDVIQEEKTKVGRRKVTNQVQWVNGIPDLTTFTNVLPRKLGHNWHHLLFHDILQNNVYQADDGLLHVANKLKRPNNNIMIQAPRFHAKSQVFTMDYPLWELYRDPNKRIMIVSANQEIATSFVRAIVNQLENNHDLIDKYGSLQPEDAKKWGEKAFIVERTTFEKDPSVIGLGVGGKVVSKRADIIILDDLIDMDTARTPAMRKKTLEWFENVLLPVLEDNGRIVVVGTAWYKDDLYDTLMNDSAFDVRLKLKALIYDEKFLRNSGGIVQTRYIPYKLHQFPQALNARDVFADDVMRRYSLHSALMSGVLWTDKWDYDKLMKRKSQMSSSSFMRQYLNEPGSEEEKVFNEKMLEKIQQNGIQKSMVKSKDDERWAKQGYGSMIIAVGVDLAISKKATADNSAIAVWGLDDRRRRILLELTYGKWTPDDIKQRVIDVNERFQPTKIVVENVGYQDMILQQLEEDDIPVEGFRTTAGNKFNEQTGIAHLAMLAEQGNIVMPMNQGDGYDAVKQLLYEMSVYSYDQHAGDTLMASWFALTTLRDFDQKMKDNRGYFSTPALVEHIRNRKSPHKVLLLGYSPPVYKFAKNSLVTIFRHVDPPRIARENDTLFIEPDEPFMIMVTKDERSCAYIFNKETNEIVGKLEGKHISVTMFVTLLEKAAMFFNDAQIVVDPTGEGGAIMLELQQREFDNLLVMQPDDEGDITIKEGFRITEKILPLAMDHFKTQVDQLHVNIPDEALLKEMGDLIRVDGGKLEMGYGKGQRIITAAAGLWLLDNFENDEKQSLSSKKKNSRQNKKNNVLSVPYRVFQKWHN